MAAAANIKIMKTYVALPSLFLPFKHAKTIFILKTRQFCCSNKTCTYLVNIQHSMRIIRLDGMTMTFLKKRKTPSITDYKASTF